MPTLAGCFVAGLSFKPCRVCISKSAPNPPDQRRHALKMYSVLELRHGAINMHRNQIWPAILGTFIVGLSAAVSVQAAPRQRACAEIRAACEQAGFVQGGARTGDGLFVDCIAPIIRQTPQPPRASRPLPKIDLQLVADCKAQNPNFGQRNAPPSQAAQPPARSSPLPRAATPQGAPAQQHNAPPSQAVEPPASPPNPAATPPQAAPAPQSNKTGIDQE